MFPSLPFRPFALAASLVLLCACGEAPPAAEPDDASVSTDEALVVRGRSIYVRYCALCHGQRAEGYAADHAPMLASPGLLEAASDEYLRTSIVEGRPGTPMSAWGAARGGPLSDEMLDALVAYLRSLGEAPPIDLAGVRVRGSATRARAPYAELCASCHGANGEGSDTAPSISHPAFLAAASDGFLRHTIEHGRPGTPMPSFAHLPSQTIDDLVAHVRFLSHLPPPAVQAAHDATPAPPTGPAVRPPEVGSLIINPEGPQARFRLRDERYVAADEVNAALAAGQRMIILDARGVPDWAMAHITGAAPFPFYDAEQMTSVLPRDTFIVAYCACPHAASGRVVDLLREQGFERTAVLDEGIHYWQEHGYPTQRGEVP